MEYTKNAHRDAADAVRVKQQTLDARMTELAKVQARVAVARRELNAAIAFQKTLDTPPLSIFTDEEWSGE